MPGETDRARPIFRLLYLSQDKRADHVFAVSGDQRSSRVPGPSLERVYSRQQWRNM